MQGPSTYKYPPFYEVVFNIEIMKLISVALFLALPIVSFAQNVVISSPASGASVTPGQDFTVRITRPDSLTGSTEVSVAIGLSSCVSSPCEPAKQLLGSVLYSGPYTPSSSVPSYQDFTVAVPSSFPTGAAQLNVAHFSLIGAGQYPNLQTLNSSLVVS